MINCGPKFLLHLGAKLGNVAKAPSVQYDKDHGFLLSDHAVDRIASTVERISFEIVRWAEHNPTEFYALLVFLAFGSFLAYLKSVQRKGMEIAYRKERETSKLQHSSSKSDGSAK